MKTWRRFALVLFSTPFLPPLCLAQAAQVPGTKIQITINQTIAFDATSSTFRYEYSVISGSGSIQPISIFDVQLPDVISTTITSPSGWSQNRGGPRHLIDWGANELANMITPGKSLNGFIITSIAAPDTIMAFGHGYAPLPPAVDFVDENTPPPPDFDRDNVALMTVGPSTYTFSDPATGISRLISLKYQAFSNGWIFGPGSDGIIQSLDAKLDAATASIAAGDNKTAIKQLNAFVNELEAQRGKHVSDNAFFLLTANTQFLMTKLGP